MFQNVQLTQCEKCSAYKPPRTHHCRVCKRCILRMVGTFSFFCKKINIFNSSVPLVEVQWLPGPLLVGVHRTKSGRTTLPMVECTRYLLSRTTIGNGSTRWGECTTTRVPWFNLVYAHY